MANGHGGRRAGAGKKKGTVHEATRKAKEAIELAFAHLQGVEGKDFHTWAEMNTDDFYKLLFPKLLPVQMQHAGEDGGPIRSLSRIESVIVDPKGPGS